MATAEAVYLALYRSVMDHSVPVDVGSIAHAVNTLSHKTPCPKVVEEVFPPIPTNVRDLPFADRRAMLHVPSISSRKLLGKKALTSDDAIVLADNAAKRALAYAFTAYPVRRKVCDDFHAALLSRALNWLDEVEGLAPDRRFILLMSEWVSIMASLRNFSFLDLKHFSRAFIE